MEEEGMTPALLRQMTGVDRLPQPVDPAALQAALKRHYPPEVSADGVSGSVLLDVRVDEAGGVASVTAIDRPAGVHATMVLQERDGTERRVEPNDHPAFRPAAQAALRQVRFTPAMRDGRPVPFTLRMTVIFDPPAAAEG